MRKRRKKTEELETTNIIFSFDGKHSWDGCIYEDSLVLENVLLVVSTCPENGKVSIGWRRQPNTKDITEEYDEDEWVYSGADPNEQ